MTTRLATVLMMIGAAAFGGGDLAAQAQGPLPADSLPLSRKYSVWFMSGPVDSLWAAVVPGGSGPLASRDALAAIQSQVAERAGREVSVVEERFAWRGGMRQYWRTMTMSNLPEPFLLRWVLRPDGRIVGIGMGLASEAPPADSGGPIIKRP